MGLTEQTIKKNTLDKREFNHLTTVDGRVREGVSSSEKGLEISRHSSGSPFGSSEKSPEQEALLKDDMTDDKLDEFDRDSYLYSQNVEADSSESSEVKYLFGTKFDPAQFDATNEKKFNDSQYRPR